MGSINSSFTCYTHSIDVTTTPSNSYERCRDLAEGIHYEASISQIDDTIFSSGSLQNMIDFIKKVGKGKFQVKIYEQNNNEKIRGRSVVKKSIVINWKKNVHFVITFTPKGIFAFETETVHSSCGAEILDLDFHKAADVIATAIKAATKEVYCPLYYDSCNFIKDFRSILKS